MTGKCFKWSPQEESLLTFFFYLIILTHWSLLIMMQWHRIKGLTSLQYDNLKFKKPSYFQWILSLQSAAQFHFPHSIHKGKLCMCQPALKNWKINVHKNRYTPFLYFLRSLAWTAFTTDASLRCSDLLVESLHVETLVLQILDIVANQSVGILWL